MNIKSESVRYKPNNLK